MAKQFAAIEPAHRDFIARQHIFFTASAAAGSRVNVSPRGMDGFRVLGPLTVAYMDRTGSGNETSAHLRADGRLTIMFCGFEGVPSILRLYGKGRVLYRHMGGYSDILAAHFDNTELVGARQIVVLDIDLVQTSCGFGVPVFDYQGERDQLDRWAAAKGSEGMDAYRREKNAVSMDGLPTGMFAET